jgi:hypothetical protein
MSKVTIELTRRQARQVWHLLCFDEKAIAAALKHGNFNDNTAEDFTKLLGGKYGTTAAWDKVDEALAAAGIDPFEK